MPSYGSLIAPVAISFCRYLSRKSMATMNSAGERGSPYRTPLFNVIFFPNNPFISTCEVPCRTELPIHAIHTSGNPICAMTCIIKLQLTVSNAFLMSNFSITKGIRLALGVCKMCWAYIKLFVICRFF